MDIMEKINDLRAQKGELLGQANALAEAGNVEELEQVTAKMEGINTSIQALERLAQASQGAAQPVRDLGGGEPPAPAGQNGGEAPTPFHSLGEQLKSIAAFRKSGTFDKRLQVVNEALGNQEGVGQDGGLGGVLGEVLRAALPHEPPPEDVLHPGKKGVKMDGHGRPPFHAVFREGARPRGRGPSGCPPLL